MLSDRAGNLLVAWDRRDKQRRGGREILVTERAADARAFTAPRVVARGRDRLVTAAMGAGGAAALLLADGRQAAVLRRLGPRRFALAPPLPGRTRISLGSRLLAVDASGGVLVSYRVELNTRESAARTVRLGADGSVRYTDARDCDPLGLAGAASGAALLTLACPRNADGDGDGDIDEIGGAVQTFSPQEP